MKKLYEPITIKSVTSKNRIMLSPMAQYSAIDGKPNDWHLVNYGSRAVGQTGIIMLEATAVEPRGRITPGDLGIYQDDVSKYREITSFIKSNGSVPGIQLAHAGRKASVTAPWEGDSSIPLEKGGWQTVAPSDIGFDETWPAPKKLSELEIEEIEQKFAEAARRALMAGFEIVEIHAAHGYLIHEFLSPISNHRTDKYGGSFNNRIRFLVEVVEAIRTEWPENYPLFVRISATDWLEQKSWKIRDSVRLAKILKNHDVDLIDVSTGGIGPHIRIPARPGYQVQFSREIKKTGILTAAVGIIYDPDQAEEILESDSADIVAMGRELLRDPYWPLHAAKTLNENISWPVQYRRAKR